MNWLIFAFLAPALFASINYIDKYLLSKYLRGAGIGSLVIFSSLIGFVVFPMVYLFKPDVLQIDSFNALLLIINSIIALVGIILYLYALDRDETSIVAPLWQLIPVLGLVLGYIFLGESISPFYMFASSIVMIGAVILSLDLSESKKIKIKKDVFLLMFFSSLCFALSGVLFKEVALEESFWRSIFWRYVGSAIFGIFLFVFIKSYRDQFVAVLKENKQMILGLNGLNEVVNIFGELSFNFAILLAPLFYVLVIEGTQPFFVFIYGIILTMLFPKIIQESIDKKTILHKLIALSIMFIGTVLLTR